MKKYIAVALVILLSGCTHPDSSMRTLEAAGYTQVQMHGYAIFGCAEEDTFHDSFTAIGSNGKPVSGVVCSGWFKGSTIRLD